MPVAADRLVLAVSSPEPSPTCMSTTVRLRPWQKAALEKFTVDLKADFLAVATPGAGKTTFALTAVRHLLAQRPHARIVVVAPTQHLKLQWAAAAPRLRSAARSGVVAERRAWPTTSTGS